MDKYVLQWNAKLQACNGQVWPTVIEIAAQVFSSSILAKLCENKRKKEFQILLTCNILQLSLNMTSKR
jgi:hypothetical protein